MQEFEGRVAIVTGAASGIGRGLVERLLQERMRVVMADVEEGPLRDLERKLQGQGHEVLAVRTDVSKSEDVQALGRTAMDIFGSIDLLCNNAGIALAGRTDPMWGVPLNDWKWAIDVNVWGVIHGIHHIVPLMLAQGTPGHVVNTASIVGLFSSAAAPVYAMTKHAVVQLSEALCAQLRQQGAAVGVTVLCPGVVDTQITRSERNRPAELGAPTHLVEPSAAYHKAVAAGSLSPHEVAGMVVDAIRTEQFYLLTAKGFDPAIEQRGRDILARQNPTFFDVMELIVRDAELRPAQPG